MREKYQVICLDGETRHSAPFATLSAAIRWTVEGHACAPASVHDLVVCQSLEDEIGKGEYEGPLDPRFDAVEIRVTGPAPEGFRSVKGDFQLASTKSAG